MFPPPCGNSRALSRKEIKSFEALKLLFTGEGFLSIYLLNIRNILMIVNNSKVRKALQKKMKDENKKHNLQKSNLSLIGAQGFCLSRIR